MTLLPRKLGWKSYQGSLQLNNFTSSISLLYIVKFGKENEYVMSGRSNASPMQMTPAFHNDVHAPLIRAWTVK